MPFDMASFDRRIGALEGNRGASLRFATVSTVQPEKGTVRVVLEDGDGMVSYPLQVLFPRAGKDTVQDMPDVGDRVAVLFSGAGLEAGVVLGGYYSDANVAPSKNSDVFYRRFSDGTELSYDRKAHKLSASVQGDAECTVTGSASLTAEGAVMIESSSSISLKAPSIVLSGAISSEGHGGGAGTFNMKGRVDVDGTVDSTGDMKAEGISVAHHTHTCPDGQTSGPQ